MSSEERDCVAESSCNERARESSVRTCDYAQNYQPDWIAAYYWFAEAAKQIGSDKNVAASLGRCFEVGQGVGNNTEDSLKWYLIAARSGDIYYQAKAAQQHEKLKQMQDATKLYRLAAERKLDSTDWSGIENRNAAQFRLAQLLEQAEGVDKDMHEAVKWYTAAATENSFKNSEADFRLGQILKYGIGGITKDINSALKW